MAVYANYLQAGYVIPRWELIHSDDTTTNSVLFQARQADEITEEDLKWHLIRVRADNNNLKIIADSGSPTLFVNNKTATTLQFSVRNAKRTQLGERTTKQIEWPATTVTKYRHREGFLVLLNLKAGRWTLLPSMWLTTKRRISWAAALYL